MLLHALIAQAACEGQSLELGSGSECSAQKQAKNITSKATQSATLRLLCQQGPIAGQV